MNAATRMSNLLLKIKVSKGKSAYDTFEDVFGVKGCIPVASKLGICDKQINVLSEKSDIRLVSYLNRLFNCKGLNRDITTEKKMIDHYIMTLNTAGAYMDDENVNDKDIIELSEMMEVLRAKVEQSDMPDHYREIIDSFIDEMRDAIDDIDIGGIKAFMSHTEVANGKVVMYHEAFVRGGVMDDVSKMFDMATKIMALTALKVESSIIKIQHFKKEGVKMHNKAFGRLLAQLEKLTFEQTKKVEKHLHTKSSIENLEEITGEVNHCPHCKSESFHKWGIRAGLQRYRCKACSKTFNALTHTPLARLRHKEVWMDYAQDLIEGKSIRQCAKHCKVDKSTTFRWRHRMLEVPKETKAEHLHGIVEFDETYFLESHKGERDLERKPRKRGGKASKRGISSEQTAVLVVRDRNGNTTDSILEKSNQETVANVMIPVLDNDALLCSDTKPSYKAFAHKYHFILKTINASKKEHVKGIYHIQNVNAYDSRLKAWMKHFHGVATKYLDSYLGWMRLLDREKNITAKQLLAVISGRDFVLQPLMRS